MSHPKSMGLLEIKGKKFRLKTFPYTQHRPLVYADVVLADVIAPADQGKLIHINTEYIVQNTILKQQSY